MTSKCQTWRKFLGQDVHVTMFWGLLEVVTCQRQGVTYSVTVLLCRIVDLCDKSQPYSLVAAPCVGYVLACAAWKLRRNHQLQSQRWTKLGISEKDVLGVVQTSTFGTASVSELPGQDTSPYLAHGTFFVRRHGRKRDANEVPRRFEIQLI